MDINYAENNCNIFITSGKFRCTISILNENLTDV